MQSRLEADFRDSTGAALLEWASPRLAYYKILNDMAFTLFQQSGGHDFGNLFTATPIERLRSADIGRHLTGEFFDRIIFGHNFRAGDGVNMIGHGGIMIGDNVSIGDDVQLSTVFHSIHPSQRLPVRTSSIIIEPGAVIETGALIISSRRSGKPLVIGSDARIMKNAVVVSDVAPGDVVAGRPAKSVTASLGNDFNGARHHDGYMNILSPDVARCLVGRDVDVCTPVSLNGINHLSSEGFFLINRRCRLDLQGKTLIGRGTLLAPAVSVIVEPGGELTIGRNVWAGAGATIHVAAHQKVTVGDGSIIGAGATVTRDVEPNTMVVERDLLKRVIGDSDYDSHIPAQWTNIEDILELRSEKRVCAVQQEIEDALESGEDLRDLMRTAYNAIGTPVIQQVSSRKAEERQTGGYGMPALASLS